MNLYLIPCTLALSIKLLLFWKARHSLQQSNQLLVALLLGFVAQGVIEISILLLANSPELGLIPVTAYYVVSILNCGLLLSLSIRCSGMESKLPVIATILLALAGITPLLIPGAAITDIQSIEYSLTAVKGPYYGLLRVSLLILLVSTIAVLCYGTFFQKQKDDSRRQSITLLAATLPLITTAISVILLMAMSVKINATVLISCAVTLMIWILTYSESKNGRYKILTKIPFTREYHDVATIQKFLCSPSLGVKNAKDHIEKLMIIEALRITYGDKSKACELLGFSRQTLSRRINEHGIEIEA